MITLKTIWMTVTGAAVAVMIVYRLVTLIRFMSMNDQRSRVVHRRV